METTFFYPSSSYSSALLIQELMKRKQVLNFSYVFSILLLKIKLKEPRGHKAEPVMSNKFDLLLVPSSV